MNAVITAKVTATGTASFATSATIDASVAAVYVLNTDKLTVPVTHTDQVHAPLITNNLAFGDEIQVHIDLPIRFNFQLSVLSGILKCSSYVDVSPFIDYTYSTTTKSASCTTAAEPADLSYGITPAPRLHLIRIISFLCA